MITIISESLEEVKISVKFKNAVYIESFSTTPFIINRFKWMVGKKWGLKAYHYLKKNSKLIGRDKI